MPVSIVLCKMHKILELILIRVAAAVVVVVAVVVVMMARGSVVGT